MVVVVGNNPFVWFSINYLMLKISLHVNVVCGSKSHYHHHRYPLISGEFPIIRHRDREKLDQMYDEYHLSYCQKPATCQPLNYTTCMGAKLTYASTTLELTDLKDQSIVQERLLQFQHLRYLPKCWAVIQPFLCALYMPKCDQNVVDLPSWEMCKITLEPCKLFYKNVSISPKINCGDTNLFPSKCKNAVHELKFNTTGLCMEPLIKTDQSPWFYPDVEGCGLRCKDALYREDEHHQIHKLIAYGALICITLNLFTVVTFLIDWKTANNKYPALTIFYMNFCFLIAYCGWLVQFLGPDTRDDVICKKDGTRRKFEPSANENLSCVMVFVMIYYFSVGGMVWFVLFTYTWYMSSLQALGRQQGRVEKKRAYFHLVAWSLPLILTITTMAIGEIDGNYVEGICFVGVDNFTTRSWLLLVPVAVAILIASYIIVRGLILLVRVKIEGRDVISAKSNRKIRSNIVRMGVFALFMLLFTITTFIYHIYMAINNDVWANSLYDFIVCKLTSFNGDSAHCRQEARPSVAMLQLQLLSVFGAGAVMASWVWCTATIHSWTRYIRRKLNCELDEEPLKLQKHKIIAQAFAKRKKFNEGGRISIECNPHTDPVGLNFDLNSAAPSSNAVSTTWAANLPRLVNRRDAVTVQDDQNHHCHHHHHQVFSNNTTNFCSLTNSIDSEMSCLNVRHVSIESRCNSADSQLSVQIAELKATTTMRRKRRSRHRTTTTTTRMRDFKHAHCGRKAGSTTSLDSHLRLINALTNHVTKTQFPANQSTTLNKRRTGNAGLNDGQHINDLLLNGKLVIPYVSANPTMRKNSKTESTNDEDEGDGEEVSVTISENRVNMVLTNNNLDLNDRLTMKSLRQGLHIDDLSTSTSDDNDIDDDDNDDSTDDKQDEKSDSSSSCTEAQNLLM